MCLIFQNIQQEGATITGRLWSELLYTLTTFCNNCDQHSTIPNELPIVEQIAVLHRLGIEVDQNQFTAIFVLYKFWIFSNFSVVKRM